VDLVDFATFAACYYGPAQPAGAGCEEADLDGDNDVDLDDFATFANHYTGAL
jgi:hypothetical protein